MNKLHLQRKLRVSHLAARIVGLTLFVFLGAIYGFANHPVFVEGNCLAAPSGSSPVITTGTCGDYDGDGRIGTAEDNDGDNIFGTIRGANGTTGANNNGTITIVKSGVFAEINLTISGNVTLQAAPGVEAIIDAVLQGDPDNAVRQGSQGIYVLAGDARVSLRNLTIKNYRTGILTAGVPKITVENVKIENCVDYGIRATGGTVISMFNSSITSTGFRMSGAGNFPSVNAPAPGYAMSFEASAIGNIVSSTVSNNFARAISNIGGGGVCISNSSFVNNGTNFVNTSTGSVSVSASGCYQ